MDTVLVDRGVQDDFSILGGNGVASPKEGDAHEFAERVGRGNLASDCGTFRNDSTCEGLQPGEVGGGGYTGGGEAEAPICQAEGLDQKRALGVVDETGELGSQWKEINQGRCFHGDNNGTV